MFKYKAKNRWEAFGLHLLISLGLFIAMCGIIVIFWYPDVLFATEGGWQGVRLIASIDFVIGPILTLLVYKPGKRGLKFDLVLIGLLQTICIIYGMYTVHYSRPAVVAYADGIYYTTPLLRFDSRAINVKKSALLQRRYPVWVNIKLPDDKQERLQIKINRVWKGLETAIDLYEPYTEALRRLPVEGASLEEAAKAGLTVPANLDHTKIRAFKLVTRYDTHAVAVDVNTGKFVTLLGVIKPGELGLVVLKQKDVSMLNRLFGKKQPAESSTNQPLEKKSQPPPTDI